MRFKKILQGIFKKTFRNLFLLFYGKIIENTNSGLKLEKIQVENKNLKSDTISTNDLYIIPNCRVYTDLNEHVAVIKDNFIIPNISYQQIKGELKKVSFNKTLNTGTPRFLKKINGNVLSLVQGASGNNYFHFLFDIVTKIKICEQKIDLHTINFFYLPGKYTWQKKILSVFNIDPNKIIDSQKNRHILAENLFVVEHPWYKTGFVQNEIINIPDWIIFYLREKFINLKKRFDANEKIFIDRSDSIYNHCKLINNAEVINFFEDNGFTSYRVSELDFFEQIYLFNNAKVIIGPHGAAFTNLIFSNPKTKVVEIIPNTHISQKCNKLSKILDLNYYRFEISKVENQNLGDMILDLNHMDKILNL